MTRSSAGSKAQKTNPTSQKSKTSARSGPRDGGIVPQPSREPVPMKRHKSLFLALMSVFVAWVGVMLGMYFRTVRPQHHLAPSPPPPQSPQPPGATTTTSPTTRALARMIEPSRSPLQSPML